MYDLIENNADVDLAILTNVNFRDLPLYPIRPSGQTIGFIRSLCSWSTLKVAGVYIAFVIPNF